MPILKEEPSLFPETLIDELPCDVPDRCWYALYTKARQEKSLARELHKHRVPFYLPLVKKTNVSRGRRRISLTPLFGGYLFLYGAESERVRALATNRVSRVLAVEDPEQLVFDLRQLRQLIAAGAPLTIESRLDKGRRKGPTRGLRRIGGDGGETPRRNPAVGLREFSPTSASVEIDDFLLEPLDL